MATAEGESDGVLGIVLGYKIDFMEELGRGAFGTVYKGQHHKDGTEVAIKKVSKKDKQKASTESVRFLYMRDRIDHENIVKVFDVKSHKDSMWIFMEFCDLGDLNDFFKNYGNLVPTVKHKSQLMLQIAQGIAFLHQNNIVHRDIKPGNILVKVNPDRHAVVKLGDFGLSKILDPDAQTSAMSSDVGTYIFKAPEFWDKLPPDDRLRYHRNIDMYAAGLTFAAMLQVQPGFSLVPRVEGSLQPSETRMPIGLAGLTRRLHRHPEITLLVACEKDTILVRNIKAAITEMTNITPEKRPSAPVVESRLREVLAETVLTPCFNLSTENIDLLNRMCFSGGHLVVSECHNKQIFHRIYDGQGGGLLKRWPNECAHCSQSGSLTSFIVQGPPRAETLLEGCVECRAICMYHSLTQKPVLVAKNVSPDIICCGPDGIIFVYEKESTIIRHFIYNGKDFFEQHQLDPFNDDRVVAMCFSHACDILVLIFDEMMTIRAVNYITGDTVWQRCDGFQPYVSDVCRLGDGRLCVTSGNSLFALDPNDGSLLETLLEDENLGGAWRVISSGRKLAVRHGHGSPGLERISCYDFTLRPVESGSRKLFISVPKEL